MLQKFVIDLDDKIYEIPVFKTGDSKGKKLVITAGVDGDEYASIEAAYRLINEYSNKSIKGELIVVPIVNMPGFYNKSSNNPIDGKSPKDIFPGNINGSSSEKLIYWLSKEVLASADVWLDLHGGGITEKLEPYLYSYKTKDENKNYQTNNLLKNMDTDLILNIEPGTWKKADNLNKTKTIYFLLEAGCSGVRDEVSIQKHISWVKSIIFNLEMIESPKEQIVYHPDIFQRMQWYKATETGLWYPKVSPHEKILAGHVIGEIRSKDQEILTTIVAEHNEVILFYTQSMPVDKDEIIAGSAYQQIKNS